MTGWPLLILLALASLTSSSNEVGSYYKCGFPTGNKLRSHSLCAQTGLRRYFRDQHDCGKFYQCNRGTAYEFLCAEGLAFNEERNACEHISRVSCPSESSDPNNTHQLEYDFVRASGAGQRNSTSQEPNHSHQLEYDFVRASGAGQRNSTSHDPNHSHQLEYDFVRASGAGQRNSTSHDPNHSHQLEYDFVRASGAGQRNSTSHEPNHSHQLEYDFVRASGAGQRNSTSHDQINSHQLEYDFVRASGAGQRNSTSHDQINSHQLEYDFVRASGAGQHISSTCKICQQAKEVIPRHANCPRTNGYYPVMFRNQKDCSQFYQCDSGHAYLIQCPAGLYFNTKLSVCDYPQNVDCNGPVIDKEVASGASGNHGGSCCPVCQSATNVVRNHPDCPTRNGQHPVMFRHRADCTKYYQCDNGAAFEIKCPAGLHFNTVLNVCDYPEKAGCSDAAGGSGHEQNQPCVICQQAKEVIERHANCPRVNGYYPVMFRNQKDCSQFYQCDHGNAFLVQCPAGLNFNTQLNVCDYPRNVDCNGPILNEESTNAVTGNDGGSSCPVCQSATYVVRNHPDCPARNGHHPMMFRHTTVCTKYYQCDNGDAFEITCPAGLHFNTVLNQCDYPEKAGCSGVPAVGSGVVGEKPTVSESVPKLHPNCPAITGKQEAAYWAHPHECDKYFGCKWGCVELLSCPAGHFWDNAKKACAPARSVKCENAEW